MIFFFFFWGAGDPENALFLCVQNSQNIDGFRQNDSQGIKKEFIKLYKQNPLQKTLMFTIYQNYTLALSFPQRE